MLSITIEAERDLSVRAKRLRVLIVDDHAIWRGGVRSMLEDTEYEVVGEAGSGVEAVAAIPLLKPDVVLLDVRMAGGDGLTALPEIKRLHPTTVVVMVSTYDNPVYIQRAFAAGAAGYLLKGSDQDEFVDSLRRVMHGVRLPDDEAHLRPIRNVSEAGMDTGDLVEPLTERETEILRLMANGLNNHEIGAELFISDGTVKTHVAHVIHKIGVADRIQAAVWAIRAGLADETA